MTLQYRHADQIYVSAFLKESAFDTAETVQAASGCSLVEFEATLSYDHSRRDGVGEGSEFGSEGYMNRKNYTMNITFPFLRPNDLAFLAAFGLGITAATQDAAVTAYRHKNTLATDDDAIPFSVVFSEAGIQKVLTGCAINTFSITKSGEYWSGSCEIIGSRIASNADSFPAEIAEEPMTTGNTLIFTETGANVSVDAAPTQGAENISAATPTNITGSVIDGPTLTVNNNLRNDQGYLATNATDTLCKGQLQRGAKREISVEWTQTFEADTDLTTFLGSNNVQTHMAIEIDHKETAQGVIAATGAMFYGFNLILPRGVLDVVGSSADDDGILTRSLKLIAKTPTSADENSTDVIQLYVYTAQAAYAG